MSRFDQGIPCCDVYPNFYFYFIFEHLHTSIVMFYNKHASQHLHDSNATSASTPQEYSVMHSCPNKHLKRILFHLTTRGGVKLQ